MSSPNTRLNQACVGEKGRVRVTLAGGVSAIVIEVKRLRSVEGKARIGN